MLNRSALLSAALVCGAAFMGCSCGSNSDSGSGPGPGNSSEPKVTGTPRSAPPAELRGDWQHGTISFLNFWDDHGNNMGPAGGIAVYFQFLPDGSYKEWVYFNARTYSCETQTWSEFNGTATFEGNSFTLYPNVGHYKASDTCNFKNNFERPMTVEELKAGVDKWVWKWDSSTGVTWLMIGHTEEVMSSFQRP